MPCYDGRDSPEYARQEARREFRHNSDVAERLCSLMLQIEAGELKHISPELQMWWTEHKARDAAKAHGGLYAGLPR